jgi:hypothetical protein
MPAQGKKMIKTCADPICRKAFEAAHGQKKYCSPECEQRHWYAQQSPEYKADKIKALNRWRKEYPEQTRTSEKRGVAKRYRAGKLAPWMLT